jgi:hypothetical protein
VQNNWNTNSNKCQVSVSKFSGAILRCFIIILLENMNKIKMYLYFIHVFQEKFIYILFMFSKKNNNKTPQDVLLLFFLENMNKI